MVTHELVKVFVDFWIIAIVFGFIHVFGVFPTVRLRFRIHFQGVCVRLGVRARTECFACCRVLFILLCRPVVLLTFRRNGARYNLSYWWVIHALHFVLPFLHWHLLFICAPKFTGCLTFSFSSRLAISL